MDKTIKELAELYGMSKQAISYHIKKVPKEYKNFDTKNGVKFLVVNEKGQEILDDLLSNKVTKEVENSGTKKDFAELEHKIELLELENRNYKEKIDSLEKKANDDKERIDTLIRLLDQQQQLSAIAEKKVAELEQKNNEEPKKAWWKIW